MTVCGSSPGVEALRSSTIEARQASRGSNRWSSRLAWTALAALVISNVPLFVCMPLTADTALYDLQAEMVLEGGVLYRDIFEVNLPGVVWLHVLVRSLLGWSSEAIRVADLAIFTGIVLLLTGWLRRFGRSSAVPIWTAVALYGFYFSLSEWCHCQRDTWMLFFALLGLSLRRRQVERLSSDRPDLPAGACRAFAEGAVWGLGFWIKPFVAVPALASWIVAWRQIGNRRHVAVDFAALLGGGIAIGGAGVAWMSASGAWPYFVEIMTEWNPEYFAARESFELTTFVPSVLDRQFRPWIVVHAVAVPLAVIWLKEFLRGPRRAIGTGSASAPPVCAPLFGAFYLGWVVQSLFLQHFHGYVIAPGIVLAIPVVAAGLGRFQRWALRPAIAVLVGVHLISSPAFRPDRLACWRECVANGSTPEIRDRVKRRRLDAIYPGTPHSRDLAAVAGFLVEKNLRDGELTCYSFPVLSLYHSLDLRPPSRFVCPREFAVHYFPSRSGDIRRSLESSPQKYVVTDLVISGFRLEEALAVGPDGPSAAPPAYPRDLKNVYPWSHPVVFRAGRYLVHRVSGSLGEFAPEPLPREKKIMPAASAIPPSTSAK